MAVVEDPRVGRLEVAVLEEGSTLDSLDVVGLGQAVEAQPALDVHVSGAGLHDLGLGEVAVDEWAILQNYADLIGKTSAGKVSELTGR